MSQPSRLLQPFRHALPVGDRLFHQPLYLTHAGWERIAPGEAYPQSDSPFFFFDWREGRTLPEFCLAMVLVGTGEYQTRDHAAKLMPGDVFLFRPGEWHRHRPAPRTGWTLMWIHFNGDEPLLWLRDRLFRLERNRAAVEEPCLFRQQFEHLLAVVHRHPTVNQPNYSRLALGLLAHLLVDPDSRAASGDSVDGDPLVMAAVGYIWNFSHDIVDVPAVARRLGVARRTLDRRFKQATGRSVLEEIQSCRVSRAARLLRETAMPVKHIVHRAGFRSAEHLRLSFQKNFGCSPREYRADGKSPGQILLDAAAHRS